MRDMQSRDENISSFRHEGRSSCGIKCLRLSSHRQAYTYFMRNSTVEWRILKEMAQIVLKRNRCEWFELPCFAKEKKTNPEKANFTHGVLCKCLIYRVAWMHHWSWGIICCSVRCNGTTNQTTKCAYIVHVRIVSQREYKWQNMLITIGLCKWRNMIKQILNNLTPGQGRGGNGSLP